MDKSLRHLREGYQPTGEVVKEVLKKGYQPAGPEPAQLNPPKVGSAAVKPTQSQTSSDNGQKK